MTATVHCFVPYTDNARVATTVAALRLCKQVSKITLLVPEDKELIFDACEQLHIDGLKSSATMRAIAEASTATYTLLYTNYGTLMPGQYAIERMAGIAADSGAGMVYADRYTRTDGVLSQVPVIDYQEGSLRDDFDFGSLLLFDTAVMQQAAADIDAEYSAAGLYDLRLRISRIAPIVHINEYLYTDVAPAGATGDEAMFAYVDPRNRAVQMEMELACTAHLKAIGAYLEPMFRDVDFDSHHFDAEASVIIPVRNRMRTIADAIESVLRQKTDFKFNLIIVDNHSTDGTTDIIRRYAEADNRIVHIIPARTDLGIGGCWNEAAQSDAAGKFCVQLDSDDVYADEHTLNKIVHAFYDNNAAMVIGSYMLTDFDLRPIPPGIIDHREWTADNGRNNALRINGLGAPRAFYTPLLRSIKVPNTSYGEDYALGLAFSRNYRIGRIFDVLYYCRRWEDNSDAGLSVAKSNANNLYKDRLRTWEVNARRKMNKSGL